MLAVLTVLVALLTAFTSDADRPTRTLAARAARVREVIGHRGSCADRPENTLAGVRRAIAAGAHLVEVDVRTTRDGHLVCLHDPTVDRTTDGKGKVSELSLAELKKLDAGRRFDVRYRGEQVPTLEEVLRLAGKRIGVMIDLKEEGDTYSRKVAREVLSHGEPKRVVLGVRSLAHVRQFQHLLPEARQLGLVPAVTDIEPFARAGVKTVRLWPRWLTDETLVPRVRKLGLQVHLGTGKGSPGEVLPLLRHEPESLSSDDPERLLRTLAELRAGRK